MPIVSSTPKSTVNGPAVKSLSTVAVASVGITSTLVATSVLLGAVFLALGLALSAWVRDRGTAAGLAIGIWILLVLVYDLGLLGLLASQAGTWLDDQVVTTLLLANPTDVYRMINLAGTADVRALSAMSSLAGGTAVSPLLLVGLLLMWVIGPFILACTLFGRRQI